MGETCASDDSLSKSIKPCAGGPAVCADDDSEGGGRDADEFNRPAGGAADGDGAGEESGLGSSRTSSKYRSDSFRQVCFHCTSVCPSRVRFSKVSTSRLNNGSSALSAVHPGFQRTSTACKIHERYISTPKRPHSFTHTHTHTYARTQKYTLVLSPNCTPF